MGNIATRTDTFGGGDYRWLQSARGTHHPKSGTANLSTFTPVNGVIPAGTPMAFAAGLYVAAATTDTVDTLAGFLYHDTPVVTGQNPTIAVLTDATIIASLVPGTHDLTDGRYQTDTVVADTGGV